MKIETKQWRGLSEKKLKPLIILTYPYLVIWIIIPTVTNVPEPVLVPEADEPVHQYAGVEHPPAHKNVSSAQVGVFCHYCHLQPVSQNFSRVVGS